MANLNESIVTRYKALLSAVSTLINLPSLESNHVAKDLCIHDACDKLLPSPFRKNEANKSFPC